MNSVIPIKQVDLAGQQVVNYRDVLTDKEIKAIEHECSLYEIRPAAAIDALQIVQNERRWISDESLYAIANMLDMSATELEGVATFYNLIYRHPVGEHNCIFPVCYTCGESAPIGGYARAEQVRKVEQGEGFNSIRPVIEVRGVCQKCS